MKLKQRINPDLERKLKDAVFVGRLVREEDLAGTLISEPVYFKDEFSEDLQFHIKCLSPIPEELSDNFYFPNKVITGGTRSPNNFRKLNEWINFDQMHHFEKKDKLLQFLENKLIVFNLSIVPGFIYAELLKVENISPSEKGYWLIPSPQLRLDEAKDEFEKKLVEQRRPFTLKHYPHIFESPEFIYYQGTLYKVSLNPSQNPTTYTQSEIEEVYYHPSIDSFFMKYVDARLDEHLYFIRLESLVDLRDEVEKNKRSLNSKIENATKLDNDTKEEEKELVNNQHKTQINSKYSKLEIEFIELLKKNAQRRGLYFNEEDLYAFHISAKTNLLSIIGGMSGTGKSQLAKLYGETMNLEYGKELLMIPVSPSYHEPNDVLGYLNPTTGVYHESETGLVSLLLEAEQTPEKMFMVIFDEMNLSQVEHWFSPFISLLEIEEENRYLTLFNKGSYCVNNKYKSQVRIGNNIIFVGTVNFDETTKDFSDRLLDRTNVITPTKLSFKQSLEILRNQDEEDNQIESVDILTNVYRKNWVYTDEDITRLSVLSEEEIEILDAIHELLHKGDLQKGVSFRVALGIARFLANIPVNKDGKPLIERSKAFDMQINQRILTKIKGLDSYVRPLVGAYSNGQYINGEIANLLTTDEAQLVSTFDISLKTLKSKAKELMLYGFAK